MKKIVLTLGLLVVLFNNTMAQVKKADFDKQINDMQTYMKLGNIGGQINADRTFNGLMDKQMSWLRSDISKHQDDIKSLKANANDVVVNNSEAPVVKHDHSNSNQDKIAWQQKIVDDENNKLNTEAGAYKNLQPLMNNIQKATKEGKDQIIVYLNQFAGTLQ